MRIVSWNVNGIRAVVGKGFVQQVDNELHSPDIICLQETKAQDDQIAEALAELQGYRIYSNSAVKKGYSGVAILSKKQPIKVSANMGIAEHDTEGRVLCAEFDDFQLVSVYTPNAQNGLARLPYRKTWDEAFKNYLVELEKHKPVIVCGDLNVAHQAIDIARPKDNYNKSAGYTQDEIDGMSNLLAAGYVDGFRLLHPDEVKYSWWSFRMNARERNIGWRIDYFVVSNQLKERIKLADILTKVEGSDHCPVVIEF
ncbi:MAG: exodeoxyribonuclease III [Flavobacteriales bacterium]